MKIAKVISSLSYGGAETQVINMSRELVVQGHQVLLITTINNNPRAFMLENSGVNLIQLNKRSRIDIILIGQLRKIFKQHKPDIIHAYLFDAEFYSRIAAFGLSIPVLNSERSDKYHLNLYQRIANVFTNRLVDGLIANSHSGLAHAKKRYRHMSADRFHVVLNGIDLDNVEKRITTCHLDYKLKWFGDDSIELAVMIAAIKPAKNYPLALTIADSLIELNPNWRVVFVGDQLSEEQDNYKQEISRKYNSMRNRDKILFVGHRADAFELLSQANVSFLTSLYEGFPNTVLESLAVGTPAVTTLFSDIRQIMPEKWLVQEELDPKLFAEKMISAADKKDQLAMNCKEWVRQKYSTKEMATNLIEVYESYIK